MEQIVNFLGVVLIFEYLAACVWRYQAMRVEPRLRTAYTISIVLSLAYAALFIWSFLDEGLSQERIVFGRLISVGFGIAVLIWPARVTILIARHRQGVEAKRKVLVNEFAAETLVRETALAATSDARSEAQDATGVLSLATEERQANNDVRQGERDIEQDTREVNQNERELIQDERSIVQDVLSAKQDTRGVAQDLRTISQDTRSDGQDQRTINQDERAASQNERTVTQDERATHQNTRGDAQDARTVTQDERTVVQDERAASMNVRGDEQDERERLSHTDGGSDGGGGLDSGE